jgi:hypothetical protein
MGTKLFSETFTWKRAPADIKRCDGKEDIVPVAAPPAVPPAATPDVSPNSTPDMTPSTVTPAPPAPQREASVAPAPAPEVAPRTQPEEAAPEPRTERRAKRKSASRQCTLDLPYFTVKYPCDAF